MDNSTGETAIIFALKHIANVINGTFQYQGLLSDITNQYKLTFVLFAVP